ncbi:DUF4377 domain-containing protein [Salinimicrobium sp. GXAS 041]|uniref:DUF4377 domain-containing protein n=1 Tax=Salinimicrobium sp. GXAS 041 TaxID=3400806 RepID=UPI003C74D9A0
MKITVAYILILFFWGCGSTEDAVLETPLRVNSYTVSCIGEMEGECLLVQEGNAIGTDDWELFYYKDDIEGFDYEEGYIYDLIVEKSEIENPPMDASSVNYKLIRIESKEKQEE